MANLTVNFRLRNTGTMPLTIDYIFASSDLFEYVTPDGPTQIPLAVGAEFAGSFLVKKDVVDQEIENLSFKSVEGPQIVVSLRASVIQQLV